MSNIDKRATELLIENGVQVADTLRHLADNEIDSDYFAICHSNENGTEIECELAITDYARQAAGIVDELVKALQAKTAWSAIDVSDADCFTITRLHEIIYASELKWPEAKLLARFMLDVKQRAGTTKGE